GFGECPASVAILAASARRVESTSQTWVIATRLVWARMWRWFLPIPPHPTRATGTVSGRAAAGAGVGTIPAAAEAFRNARRVVLAALRGKRFHRRVRREKN